MAPSELSQAQRITYLISRYIDGAIDFAELQELDHWRKQTQNNEVLFQQLTNTDEQAQAIKKMQGFNTKDSLSKLKGIMELEAAQAKVRSINWKRFLVAAISLFILGLFAYQHYYRKENVVTTASNLHPNYVPAGTNKAILTLANGKRINLDDTFNGTIARQSGSIIKKQSGGLIAYQPTSNSTDTTTQYNLIEIPRGGQYRLKLPDGTKVWLNAASSLKYPSSFNGKQRQVTLTGEGYFEVVHNPHQPFIVKTATQTIKDIGTSFNLNAYADELHITTTLVEGAIQLAFGDRKILLKPGQQATSQADVIRVSEGDIAIATAWKNGQLAFHRTNIQNVLRQVSRWYNVEIEYQGKAPEFTVSGEVSRQADLSAMLKILQLSDVHFTQKGRKLIITN